MRLNLEKHEIEQARLPHHIAIIMDGNGRWGERHNLSRYEGHRQGVKRARQVVSACGKLGIDYLTIFAFSVENWGRPAEEIAFLMNLFAVVIKEQAPDLLKNNVRMRFTGRLDKLPDNIREIMRWGENLTQNCNGLTLLVAVSYGGRQEIVDAVRKILNKGIPKGKIDEESFSQFLYTPDVPFPDLLIRTSGEYRISNFLLYQSAYTELWVTKTLWPDFTPSLLLKAISDYQKRERRFGEI